MDVNKTSTIKPMTDDGGRKGPRKKLFEPELDSETDAEDTALSGRPHEQGTQAFAMGGMLSQDIPDQMKMAFDAVASQLEHTRQQLERAQGAEARFLEEAHNHPFLPIVNRREFYRELTHVLAHIDENAPLPGLILVHVSNGDAIRHQFGRAALDSALEKICATVNSVLEPNDVFGSLCGNDFGIIILSSSLTLLMEKGNQLKQAVQDNPFYWHNRQQPVSVSCAVTELRSNQSVEEAVELADGKFSHS